MAILYLEPDDEITSAAARIREVADERIGLVLPYGSRLATSRINFRLLAREAAERGRSIEIVAADASARALAGSAGLVTHPSVSAFEASLAGGTAPDAPVDSGAKSGAAAVVGATAPVASVTSSAPVADAAAAVAVAVPSRARGKVDDDTRRMAIPVPRPASPPVPIVGRPRSAGLSRRAIAALGILVLLAASLGVAGFLYLPSATIVLKPATQTLGPISLTVVADEAASTPDPATLTIPARRFTFDAEVSDTFKATGKNVTETKASGSVLLSNCDWNSQAKVPAGAIVSTPEGVSFETDASVTIKRGDLGVVDGKIVVNCSNGTIGVTATKPGPAGNVGANTIKRIDKSYGVDPPLIVTNPSATTGGTHTEKPKVVQADIDGALQALDQKLRDALDAKIATGEGVPSGVRVFVETKQLGKTTQTVDPTTFVDKEIPEFELGLTGSASVVGVDPSPVREVAEARLRAQVGDGWQLDDATIAAQLGDAIVAGQQISFPVSVRAMEMRIVDRAEILRRVKGLELPKARTVLAEYGEATLTAWPDWVTTVPTSDGRIDLRIESAGPSPSGASASAAPAGSAP